MQQPQQHRKLVKITKCAPGSWYCNLIERTFEVYCYDGDYYIMDDFNPYKIGIGRYILPEDCEDLSAPASPVEEKSRLEDQAEYAKWILDVINDELSDAGNNDSLSCRLAFEFQAHLDAVYQGAAEWESKYKDAQNKLDRLTESKPSPVIEIGEQKVNGAELISAERQRQIKAEGWTAEHDHEYKNGELIAAAGCYVANVLSKMMEDAHHTNQSPLAKFQIYDFGEMHFMVNDGDRGDRMVRKAGWANAWPWDKKWWKPTPENRVKELTKAGALIAAEIDRLTKASHPAPAPIVREREEDQWHPQDYSGRNAPVSFYCTKPSTKPCSQQCAICAAYDPAPAEEAVPEEVKYDTIIPDFERLYFLECKRWEDTMEVMEGKDKRIDELERLVKEKQEWINSHI